MRTTLTILISLFCGLSEASTWQKGFVKIEGERRLYVEHRPAARGKFTVFMENGLTWTTRDWRPFVEALDKLDHDLGIVLYDMQGMGKTLVEYAPILQVIPFEDQVDDLHRLRTSLHIEGRTALVGLSYGGGVTIRNLAKYPEDFDLGVAFAPFIERLPEQDRIINDLVLRHRTINPLEPRTDAELYDLYLRAFIYTTFPAAEPVLWENPFKLEATFRMVQGSEGVKAADWVGPLPAGKLHVVGALDDIYVKPDRLDVYYEAAKSKIASYLKLQSTSHKINSQRPELAASWTYQILQGHPEIKDGRVFLGDPLAGEARSGDVVIPLHKASLCDLLLRTFTWPFSAAHSFSAR